MALDPWEVYNRKFNLFGCLPPEVQNMIWHLAIYDVKPRIVKVEEGTIPSTRQSTYFRRRQFISTCHIPGVLHACRASRNLALRRWKLSFAAGRQPPKIFFDFSCDTLFIPEDFRLGDFAERLNPVDRVKLSKMAISIKDLTSNDYAHNGFDLAWLLVKNFPSLTHLTLPEVNMDAVRAEGAERRNAKRRLGKPCPFSSRRKRTKPKPKPMKRVIRWFDIDLAFRQVDWRLFGNMRMLENGYGSLRHPCPKMMRVDYGTLDLDLVEYNEDQRRLDRAEGTRQVERVWELIEREQLAGTEGNSAT